MGAFDRSNYSVMIDQDMLITKEPICFMTNAGDIIVVPTGFKCDGSSIPRWCWSFVGSPFSHGNRVPGCVHDYLYRTGKYDRKTCDEIFYEASIARGNKKLTAKLKYYAVRLFGAQFYNGNS